MKAILVPEMNYTGQLAQLLRTQVGIAPVPLNIAEGRPIQAGEILQALEEVARVWTPGLSESEPAHLVSRLR